MLTKIDHLLVCLGEECAEIIQAADKALRFGLDDDYNDGSPSSLLPPRQHIVKELIDMVAIVELLDEAGAIELQSIWSDRKAIAKKKAKVLRYMEYARTQGCLEEE